MTNKETIDNSKVVVLTGMISPVESKLIVDTIKKEFGSETLVISNNRLVLNQLYEEQVEKVSVNPIELQVILEESIDGLDGLIATEGFTMMGGVEFSLLALEVAKTCPKVFFLEYQNNDMKGVSELKQCIHETFPMISKLTYTRKPKVDEQHTMETKEDSTLSVTGSIASISENFRDKD